MGRNRNTQKQINRQKKKDRIKEASAAGITVIPITKKEGAGEGSRPHAGPLRVAAYCRVSTDEEEQASSIELQKTTYTDVINNHDGWILAGIYADEGISGTSVNHREQLQRLIEDCEAGRIDMVLVKSISRLARNVVDCLSIIEKLRDLNVAIFFETDNINTLEASGRMLITVLSMVAEEESHSKSQIMNWSVENRFAKGLFLIPALYGYDKDPETDKLVINPDEAKVVKACYGLCLAGWPLELIAKSLTALGITTFTGKDEWNSTTIKGIIGNERHYGAVLAHKTYTPNFLNHKAKKNEGQRKQYLREEDHEAIVTKKVYEAANKKLVMDKARKKGSPLPSIDIVDDGVLRGFVSVNRFWQGFTDEEFLEASKSVMQAPEEEKPAFQEEENGFRLSDYEVVSGSLFSSAGKPAMNIRDGKVRFSTACMKKFGDIENVEILVNFIDKKIAVRPCSEDSPYAFRWGKCQDAKWTAYTRKSIGIVEPLFGLMGWSGDNKYQIIGQYMEDGDSQMLLFDLDEADEIPMHSDVETDNAVDDTADDASDAVTTVHFGRPALFGVSEVVFQREHYSGNWDIMRPAKLYKYCTDITEEELNEVFEEARSLLEELKGA